MKKVDSNQRLLVEQMRQLGMTVSHTHMIGKGFPDVVVGYRGRNYLFEIKNPLQAPSKRKLTQDEIIWHDRWRGQVSVVESIDDVLKIVGNEVLQKM